MHKCHDCSPCVGVSLRIRRYVTNVKRSSEEVQKMYNGDATQRAFGLMKFDMHPLNAYIHACAFTYMHAWPHMHECVSSTSNWICPSCMVLAGYTYACMIVNHLHHACHVCMNTRMHIFRSGAEKDVLGVWGQLRVGRDSGEEVGHQQGQQRRNKQSCDQTDVEREVLLGWACNLKHACLVFCWNIRFFFAHAHACLLMHAWWTKFYDRKHLEMGCREQQDH